IPLAAVGALALLALPALLAGGALAAVVGLPLAALGLFALIEIPKLLLGGALAAALAPFAALGVAALIAAPLVGLAGVIGAPLAALGAAAAVALAVAIAVLLTPGARVGIISAIRAALDRTGPLGAWGGGAAATGTQFLDDIPDDPSLEQLAASLQQLLAPLPSEPAPAPVAFADLPYSGKGAAEAVAHDRASRLVSVSL
ncbi:hypothetical protein ACFYV7_34750, partial [Nocardia suismassiliense]